MSVGANANADREVNTEGSRLVLPILCRGELKIPFSTPLGPTFQTGTGRTSVFNPMLYIVVRINWN